MQYNLNGQTSSQIIAQLDASHPAQAAQIEAVRQLEERGMRYSNEDFDVLAAARRAIGRTEPVKSYEEGFIARMAQDAAKRA